MKIRIAYTEKESAQATDTIAKITELHPNVRVKYIDDQGETKRVFLTTKRLT